MLKVYLIVLKLKIRGNFLKHALEPEENIYSLMPYLTFKASYIYSISTQYLGT